MPCVAVFFLVPSIIVSRNLVILLFMPSVAVLSSFLVQPVTDVSFGQRWPVCWPSLFFDTLLSVIDFQTKSGRSLGRLLTFVEFYCL